MKDVDITKKTSPKSDWQRFEAMTEAARQTAAARATRMRNPSRPITRSR